MALSNHYRSEDLLDVDTAAGGFQQRQGLKYCLPLTFCTQLFFLLRAVNILPNRVVGSVGQHAEEPVENLALSHCGRFLASSGHDQRLKFSCTEVGGCAQGQVVGLRQLWPV